MHENSVRRNLACHPPLCAECRMCKGDMRGDEGWFCRMQNRLTWSATQSAVPSKCADFISFAVLASVSLVGAAYRTGQRPAVIVGKGFQSQTQKGPFNDVSSNEQELSNASQPSFTCKKVTTCCLRLVHSRQTGLTLGCAIPMDGAYNLMHADYICALNMHSQSDTSLHSARPSFMSLMFVRPWH